MELALIVSLLSRCRWHCIMECKQLIHLCSKADRLFPLAPLPYSRHFCFPAELCPIPGSQLLGQSWDFLLSLFGRKGRCVIPKGHFKPDNGRCTPMTAVQQWSLQRAQCPQHQHLWHGASSGQPWIEDLGTSSGMGLQGPDMETGRDTCRERPQSDHGNAKKGSTPLFPLPHMLISGSSPTDAEAHIFPVSQIIYWGGYIGILSLSLSILACNKM